MVITNPNPFRVCFSFAAYAKNLVHHLKSSNIPVEEGLTELEFSSIESDFNFTFPPDLRSILREGLPTGQGFPNWRSSSNQQLEILANLPILGLCKEVSRYNFWISSLGDRPNDNDRAVNLAKEFLKRAPILIPVFRHFYIPCSPCLAGNPVFYVNGGDVKLWSFDIAGFFQVVEFGRNESFCRRPSLSKLLDAPAWAATKPRTIEFWTELVEREERGCTHAWWSGDLGGCLEEVFWRLRNGGWNEEDVREMMMMDGSDHELNSDHRCDDGQRSYDNDVAIAKEDLVWQVEMLSKRLLSAGWSTEDVVNALGFAHDFDFVDDDDEKQSEFEGGDSWLEFHSILDDQKHATDKLTNLHPIKV